MNRYLKNLNRIEFVVTMACTGKCKHCSQGDHTGCADSIDKNVAAEAVGKIAAEYSITSVMTFGGEPLLYPETVCAIHKTATQMNIPKRQLITNGYFSKDKEKIGLVAGKLKECGVNDVLLSVDAFHQEVIPLEYAELFAEAVMAEGISLKVQPAWLVSSDNDNAYNVRTREILRQFREMGIEENEGNVIFPAGNALKYLGEYFDSEKEYINPYRENPADIRAICLSANGDILGDNIYEKNISEILSGYAPK
ncbi:MAG: radical SAM protein [Clostridia bacterium]|nr:radical SAM protein [Clostridia bacterium]